MANKISECYPSFIDCVTITEIVQSKIFSSSFSCQLYTRRYHRQEFLFFWAFTYFARFSLSNSHISISIHFCSISRFQKLEFTHHCCISDAFQQFEFAHFDFDSFQKLEFVHHCSISKTRIRISKTRIRTSLLHFKNSIKM